MSEPIHFQDPDTGYPLVLLKRDLLVHPVVSVGDADESMAELADSAANSAEHMSDMIRGLKITDLGEAARFLRRRFGADL